MQSAYCSRFQKIKNLYKQFSFSNYYFEEINFNVFFYFPWTSSIGAICLLQSLPKNQEFVQKISFSNYYFEEINFNVIKVQRSCNAHPGIPWNVGYVRWQVRLR